MRPLVAILSCLALAACDNYYKNDYVDNSPTSGKLKVYCDEGLQPHVKNQAFTFCAQYPHAEIETLPASEGEAIAALLADSCKAIVINRLLGEGEKKLFEAKQLSPKYSPVARSGVALITSRATRLQKLTVEQVRQLLQGTLALNDSTGKPVQLSAVVDNANSSVSHYLLDSLLKQPRFGPRCYAVKSSPELIKQIAENPDQVGFIDFAWISDRDDELYKSVKDRIKFVPVGVTDTIFFEPNQSSFKTGQYPFIRTVYILRRSDDFSLAKGFETFVAGPKGQLTFLKQGLLPVRQAERVIEVKMEPLGQ